MPYIFINYRTRDEASAATVIERDLATRFGREKVFKDSSSIRGGDQFAKRILAAVHGSAALLAVIGRHWQQPHEENGPSPLADENDWVRRELLEARGYGVRVVPVLIDGAPRLDKVLLPAELTWLRDAQYRTFDNTDSKSDLAKLAAELADLVPGLADRTTPAEARPATVSATARDVYGDMITATNVHTGHGHQFNGTTYFAGPGDSR